MENVSPKFVLDAFNCPYCNAYARQVWRIRTQGFNNYNGGLISTADLGGFASCQCEKCKGFSIWKNERLIFPNKSISPLAPNDLPQECIGDYNEARDIFSLSPKASAALLRLVLQKLCICLGEKGKNINEDIANLVQKGLPPGVQKALDLVRVVGNNAVHPGEINIDDNPEIAFKLFKLINLIVDAMITQPKELNELYDNLPEKILDAIEKRDKTE